MKCPNCGKEMKSKVRDYEYVESGLKNVVLSGIKVHECKHCGEVLPEIRDIKQVHQWIAEYLLKKQGRPYGRRVPVSEKSHGEERQGNSRVPRSEPRNHFPMGKQQGKDWPAVGQAS